MVENGDLQKNKTKRTFPLYLLLFAIIPLLPFLFSTAALSFFIQSTAGDGEIFIKQVLATDIGFIDQAVKTLTHLSNLLDYLSLSSLHIIVCLIVISFLLYQIHRFPKILVKRAYLYMLVTVVLFSLVWVIIQSHSNNLMLTQLGYKSICILMSKAELQTLIVWPDPSGVHTGEACFRQEFTRLVWLAWTPIILGLLTVVVAGAFSTVMASGSIPSSNEKWRSHFLTRIKLLQKSFYMLSLVLVTSTISTFHFLSLPLDLLVDQPLKITLAKFVNGNTTFLGGIFTATLFATFLPAAILLFRQAREHQKEISITSDLSQWLHDSVFVSSKKQVVNALVMVAPMLVGPLSNLIQQVFI